MRYPPPVDFEKLDKDYPRIGKFIIMFWFFLAFASPWIVGWLVYKLCQILGIN
jgi:hypothetical protein